MTNYNNGKWHGWNGGERPVHRKSKVDLLYGNGQFRRARSAGLYVWNEPLLFRVVKEHKEPREFWIDPTTMEAFSEAADYFIRVREVVK
jgi:hypothetical protein